MNIRIHPVQAVLGLVTVIATAVVMYRLGFDGTEISWWVGAALIASIIIGFLALAFAYRLSVDDRHGSAILVAAVVAAGYTLVYFVVRDEMPGSAGWAVLVSMLVAVNLAAAATSVD